MKRVLLSLTLLLIAAENLPAGILFDSGGFESPSYNLGQLVGQSQTAPAAMRWTDFVPPGGNTFVVQNTKVNGGTQAVSVSNPSSNPGFVAPAVNYTPVANELVVLEVDIARTFSANAMSPSSNLFGAEAYDAVGNPIVSFGLRFNDISRTIEAIAARSANPSPNDVININVAENQWVGFKAELNFETKQYRLLVNGNLIAANLPFLSQAANLADFDLSHYTVLNATDIGYFDNYRITTEAVPEPNTFALCALVGATSIWRRRKR